jgi:hypothetical protein
MIETLFLLVTVVGVLLVMYWALTNDAAGNIKPTKGLFALRRHRPPPGDSRRPRRR